MAARIIYVVIWRYHDGSAAGMVSAHGTEVGADLMVRLLEQHGDGMKSFKAEPVPYED